MNTIKDSAHQIINFNYPDSLIHFLKQTQLTIILTTYQSGKIMMIGEYENKLDIRYKSFPRPMGMYATDENIWVGLGHAIWQFSNFSAVAPKLDATKRYNACYMPMDIHFTADIDIHEMEMGDELYFINTKFSCLCVKDTQSSFKPIWKPPFISSLQPTDKCHLNGLCLQDGKPRYVTALGITDEPLGWRKNKANGGILMDIQTNEILLKGLSMPHSPRWHQGKLWFLESGKGTLSWVDIKTKKVTEVVKVPGFTRGIQLINDFAFIGVSKVRESATFSGLPITKLSKRICGIWIVNIQTGKTISYIEFTAGIDEIFAVNAVSHPTMEILGYDNEYSQTNYIVKPTKLAEVKMPESPLEMAAPFFEKGNDLFNENKKEEAIEAFQKAIDIQNDYLPAIFNMAIALGDLDRFDEAEKILLDIKERDASIVETYNSLGYIYYKKQDLQKAKENFEKAIAIKPDYEQARYSLLALEKEMQKS
jgi:uncharacterized protein (TIGR03032 family)